MQFVRMQIFNQQDASTTEYDFTKPEIVVGTSSTNDIVLYHPSLSGRHLKICVANGQMEVVDLESRTGTFLNGTRIRGRKPFGVEDEVTL